MQIAMLFALAIISGILGRCGGVGKPYDTKYRDVGCSLIAVVALCLFVGFQWSAWWVYLIIFGLHWGAFSTYWDWLFKYDNFWFSGFMCGLAMLPACFILPWIWWLLLIRAVVLSAGWGLIHKFMPKKLLAWDGAVAEEFLRYAITL